MKIEITESERHFLNKVLEEYLHTTETFYETIITEDDFEEDESIARRYFEREDVWTEKTYKDLSVADHLDRKSLLKKLQ